MLNVSLELAGFEKHTRCCKGLFLGVSVVSPTPVQVIARKQRHRRHVGKPLLLVVKSGGEALLVEGAARVLAS